MQKLEIIKKTIEEFFKKTTFDVVFDSVIVENQTILINLKTKDPQILIGENGQTLNEIQYLLKIILKKKIQDFFYLDVDIDNYKKKKQEYLKEMAYLIADEVVLLKKEKELMPMSAAERRIIHLALFNRENIITESIGQGVERRIIIKPR